MPDIEKVVVPIPTVKRFPSYLRILRQCQGEGMEFISATVLAEELGLKPIQVRKDISYTGIEGKPKVGFVVSELIDYITHSLGWDNATKALIVGVGNLGKAISMYEGFAAYGLSIVAAFDSDPGKIGTKVGELTVKSMDELKPFIESSGISIAVITVPASSAQSVADTLVECGIKGIWNFAPKDLKIPGDVVMQRTDLATSFAVLSVKMRKMFGEGLIEYIEE
jgi:redox-sensing transcriptional repressor